MKSFLQVYGIYVSVRLKSSPCQPQEKKKQKRETQKNKQKSTEECARLEDSRAKSQEYLCFSTELISVLVCTQVRKQMTIT